MKIIDESRAIITQAIEQVQPTHIVSMVSGGKDSAASHAVALELGVKIDLVIHGKTGCGIPETTEWVESVIGGQSAPLAIADSGTAYQDYVLRKGFFGKGQDAHGFAYRVLKATAFRKAISREIRRGKRDVRILLLNGARQSESENRMKHLKIMRPDPAQAGNVWTSIIHSWTADDRDEYLASRQVPINPVAVQLCRSGECMCGTMQTAAERAEAAALYPAWGSWLDELEREAIRLHGYGWGVNAPKKPDPRQIEMFAPMCVDCGRTTPQAQGRDE